MSKNNFNIIILTESWLNSSIEDILLTRNKNFKVLRSDRPKQGGGILALVSTNITSTLISSKFIKGINILVFDICDIINDSSTRIITIYLPPKLSINKNILDFLCTLIGEFCSIDYPTILLGDFNMPDIVWSLNSFTAKLESSKTFAEFVSSLELSQHIFVPTRGNNTLDLVFTSNNDLISSVRTGPPLGNSDHNSILFTYKFMFSKSPPRTQFLNFFKANYTAINSYLVNVNWDTIFSNSTNIDELYNKFLTFIHSIINRFVPITTVKSKQASLPPHIQKLIEYRKKLWLNSHHPSVLVKFEKATSDLNHEIARYHKNLEKKFLSSSPNAIHKYVCKNLKPNYSSLPPLNLGNKIITNTVQKADAFADYFSSIFSNARPAEPLPSIENDLRFEYNLYFLPNFRVFESLNALPPHNNTSPDGIPNIFLKKCAVSLAHPIGCILRRSFFAGQVPNIWRKSYIIPILKKGDSSLIHNYRPISITCSLAKVAESFVNKELSSFLNSINYIPQSQHGFQHSKSVTTSLLETVDDWTLALDQKKFIDCIFFDIKKAFDTINLNRLFAKLDNVGITGEMFSWLKSFLSNRVFSTKIGSTFSTNNFTSNCGLPQGTVLAPSLFNLFIADLAHNWKNTDVNLKFFADDLKAYIIYNSSEMHKIVSLQSFINFFISWCNINGLEIADQKCYVLHLGAKNPKSSYTINCHQITPVTDHIRDLGLIVTPNLKWITHIKIKSKLAYYKWYSLFKVFKSSNHKLLVKLYKTYVRPILDFASIVYNSDFKRDSDTLELVQKRITRQIVFRCFKSYLPYHTRLALLDIVSLKDRRRHLDLSFFHKIMLNLVKICDKNLPIRTNNPTTRGHKTRLLFPCSRLNIRRHSFFVRVTKIYARLPNHIVETDSSSAFHRAIQSRSTQ